MCFAEFSPLVSRVAHVGGNFNNGANDGLWYWSFYGVSSSAGWNFGCRVLIDLPNEIDDKIGNINALLDILNRTEV